MEDSVVLHFVPPRGCAGSVTRYYHFVFDQLWPCFDLLRSGRLNRTTRVFVERRGPFVDLLSVALDWNLELFDPMDGAPAGLPVLEVAGKNPKCCRFRDADSNAFAEHLLDVFGASGVDDGPRVLFIERGEPDPFFLGKDSPSAGGGITRRSIVNHADLRAALETAYGSDLMNVQLEKRPFAEQLRLFRSAQLVIGQHGGGLTNALWMKRGGHLVEIRSWHPAFRHFKKLARDHRLAYSVYRVRSHHPVIEVESFLRFLRRRSLL